MATRTRRVYTDLVGANNFEFNGQDWSQSSNPNMTSGHTTINYSITIGSGHHTQTFSQLTIWQNGVISLGPPTAQQLSFMSVFAGSQTLNQFPGYYISAGYTDESGHTASDGNKDAGYGVEITTGQIDFNPLPDGSYQLSDAVPVLRISWASFDGSGDTFVDKQVILTANDFTIGNTTYDSQGAGYGLGRISVNGASTTIPAVVSDSGDYLGFVKADFKEDGRSALLIESNGGATVLGEVTGGHAGFVQVGALGSDWTFVGSGDYLGEGYVQFLIERGNGALVVGDASGGQASYVQVGALGSEWLFRETGNFLNHGKSDFLIEKAGGAVVVGEVSNGHAAYTQVAALGPEWTFVGAGDFLANGHDQFLIEHTNGAVMVGDVVGGQAVYTQVAALGPEWTFKGAGDFLGDGKTDFLIESSSGAVVVGEVVNGHAVYTQIAALGSEWTFKGVGDYLGEGHDQFLIENSTGSVVVGDYLNAHIQYTAVAALGPEWSFHP